jgi:hypothetical protein
VIGTYVPVDLGRVVVSAEAASVLTKKCPQA